MFSDNFNGPAGSQIDPQWEYDLGHYGHGEVETVTNSTANVHLDGQGDLDITALDQNGSWTSGRIQTVVPGIGAPAGGELEVTASIDQPDPASGLGYWPAFWMLGPGQWPESGEIDILEDVNALSHLSGTLHCGPGSGGPCNEPGGAGSGLETCPGCQSGFHTYSVVIDRTNPADESITWYLDGKQFFGVTESEIGASAWQAAVDHSFTIILNLAIGGPDPDYYCTCTTPTGTTTSGATMSVAYVAAYQQS